MAGYGTDWGAFGPSGRGIDPAAAGGDPGAFITQSAFGGVGEAMKNNRQMAGSVLSGVGQGALTGATLGSVVPGVGTLAGAGIGAAVGGLLSSFTAIIDRGRQLVDTFNRLSAGSRTLTESYAQFSYVLADGRRKWLQQDLELNRKWAKAIETTTGEWGDWGRKWRGQWAGFRVDMYKASEPFSRDALAVVQGGSNVVAGVLDGWSSVARGTGELYKDMRPYLNRAAKVGWFGAPVAALSWLAEVGEPGNNASAARMRGTIAGASAYGMGGAIAGAIIGGLITRTGMGAAWGFKAGGAIGSVVGGLLGAKGAEAKLADPAPGGDIPWYGGGIGDRPAGPTGAPGPTDRDYDFGSPTVLSINITANDQTELALAMADLHQRVSGIMEDTASAARFERMAAAGGFA